MWQVLIEWIALSLLGSLEGSLIVTPVGGCRKKLSQVFDAIGHADEVTRTQAPATIRNL
jgi:hypothetical protein